GVGLVGGVPDGETGVVPVVAHPLAELIDEFLGPPLVPAALPDGKLVLDEEAGFVGDVVPELRCRAEREAEAVPVHLPGNVDEQAAHPGLVPGMVLAFGVLEEAV